MRKVLAGVLVAASLSCSSDDDSTSSGGSSGSSDFASEQAKCVDIINQYRAKNSLPPLARWTDQESCASTEAESDGKSNKGHGAFPRCGELAQNECPNFAGSVSKNLPTCLGAMWAEGPGGGHYEAMSSTKYTKVACGIYELPNGNFWAVQDFR